MKKLLRITPSRENSIEMCYEIYAREKKNPPRFWTVAERYDMGYGVMEIEDFNLDLLDSDSVICSTSNGQNAYYGKNHGNIFKFGIGFDQAEKEQIVLSWVYGDEKGKSGPGWVEAVGDEWAIDDQHLKVYAPFAVDLINGEGFTLIQGSLGRNSLKALLQDIRGQRLV